MSDPVVRLNAALEEFGRRGGATHGDGPEIELLRHYRLRMHPDK